MISLKKDFFIHACNFILLLFLCNSITVSGQVLNKKFISGGIERDYFIHVPKNYKFKKKLPLVLAFHGAGDSAYMFMYHSGFNTLADKKNFIAVYPQGTKQRGATGWNLKRSTSKERIDDVAFVKELIKELVKNYKVDTNKIYAAGMSNGGYMAFLLACELNNSIAAVASVTGSMTPNMIEACNISRPISILQMHGTNDKAVPYSGHPKWSLSIDAVINHWTKVNKLLNLPKKKRLADLDKTDGSYVERYVYQSKSTKVKVVHYKVINGGHDWFGIRGNKDINATAIIWRFFSKHSLN